MKSAFDLLQQAWPQQKMTKSIEDNLRQIDVIEIPQDLKLLKSKSHEKSIVVFEQNSLKMAFQVLQLGFNHILDKKSLDYKRGSLTSSLMVLNPKSIVSTQVPFYMIGVSNKKSLDLDSIFDQDTKNREVLLDQFRNFLTQQPRTKAISDLAVQNLDELYSNALKISGKDPVRVRATFDQESLIIACEDRQGTLSRRFLIEHFLKLFSTEKLHLKDKGTSAGVGLRFVVENSSSFFVYVEKNKKTIIGCALRLKGLKNNMSLNKNFHFYFANSNQGL